MSDVPDDLQSLCEYLYGQPDPVPNPEAVYGTITNADTAEWQSLTLTQQLLLTGTLYNVSEDLQRPAGLDRVIELHRDIIRDDLDDRNEHIRHYQLANAYSLRAAVSDTDTLYTFFDSEDLLNTIGHARAIAADPYPTTHERRQQTQATTNFAGYLAQTGRVCEAMYWHNKAVRNDPEFGMALGKRAQTKREYAGLLPSAENIFWSYCGQYGNSRIGVDIHSVLSRTVSLRSYSDINRRYCG